MRTPYHDLLVLTGDKTMNPHELEVQVRFLNALLYKVELLDVFCIANEVFDVNRCKIIRKQHLIQQIISSPALAPFVFISSKN